MPENVIHKWSAAKGIEEFLRPSGYTGTGIYSEEPGSNGLIINKKGNLVSCEHGDRRIAEMPLNRPDKKKTLAHLFEGKKLNSPNDLVQKSSGDYFFTDPPYGLPGRGKDEPAKEIPFQGVYRIDTKGKLTLQAKDLARPNGLAFSPDEKILYVGQSDMKGLIWMAYPVNPDGNLGTGKVFYDAGPLAKKGWKGAPDGFKVDKEGNLWLTNALVANGIKVLKNGNTWQSYNLSAVIQNSNALQYGNIDIDKNGTKWMASSYDGVIAYNETGNVFKEVESRSIDNFIQFEIYGDAGEHFSAQVFFAELVVTENFVI